MAKTKEGLNEEKIKKWIENGFKKADSKKCKKGDSGNGIWFFGFVGALIYFWQYVNSFGSGVLAILKSIVWPAYLVLNLLKYLQI